MLTLSYGFKLPEDRDSGSTLWDALEGNITQLNSHSHNGTDSAQLTSASVSAITASVAAASWVATTHGNYRQLVTLPGSLDFDLIAVSFKDASNYVVYPTVERVSDNTYYVYTNDNSQTWTAIYTT